MNIETLRSIYSSNVENVFTADKFKEIASHSNGIQGYSFLNRVLIRLQNSDADNVKSLESWEICGRDILDAAKYISVIIPIYDVKYYDSVDMSEVDISSLTQLEFNRAIDIGFLIRHESLKGLDIAHVYDISNTNELLKIKIDESRKIKIACIFKFAKDLGINVTKSNKRVTSFDIKTNTLRIGSYVLEDVLDTTLDALAINCILHIHRDIRLTETERLMVREYIKYAIFTYFNLKSNRYIGFDYIDEVYDHRISTDGSAGVLIDILNAAEELVNKIICMNNGLSGKQTITGEQENHIAKRAGALLAILEANYSATQLGG